MYTVSVLMKYEVRITNLLEMLARTPSCNHDASPKAVVAGPKALFFICVSYKYS